MLAELCKEAVGANSRRIAKLLGTSAGRADPALSKLRPLQGATPQATARNVSGLLGSTSPAHPEMGTDQGVALGQARAATANLMTPKPSLKPPAGLGSTTPAQARLAEKSDTWGRQQELERSLTGRHEGNRKLYSAEDILGKVTDDGSSVFRGYTAKGSPFVSSAQPGTPLFTTGNPAVAFNYGVPDWQTHIPAGGTGQYVAKLNVPALQQAGPSGPFHPHMAMDTRSGFSNLMARIGNATGLSRLLAPMTAGVPGASHPRFERVFTSPKSTAPATEEAYKYMGRGLDGQHSFMKVIEGQPGLAPKTAAEVPPEAVAASKKALKETVGQDPLPRPPGPLAMLLRAKAESDRRNYKAKHSIMRKLLAERQGEFMVDSDDGKGIVGITHNPTSFRMHLPSTLASGLIPPPPAALSGARP